MFALPFFHIANWQAFLFHAMGGCVVISRSADPQEIVELLLRERPVLVNLVPTVYESMLRLPGIEDIDFSFVGRFTVSGAPMAAETMRRCEQVFRMRFGKGYGLTEAAPAVSSLDPDEYALDGDPVLVKRSRSVGKPLAERRPSRFAARTAASARPRKRARSRSRGQRDARLLEGSRAHPQTLRETAGSGPGTSASSTRTATSTSSTARAT